MFISMLSTRLWFQNLCTGTPVKQLFVVVALTTCEHTSHHPPQLHVGIQTLVAAGRLHQSCCGHIFGRSRCIHLGYDCRGR